MLNTASCEVSILINGKSVATHHKNGKTYIEAKEGSEYEILIKNNGGGRGLVVSSVDGLNVLTGEKASLEDSGYVVSGYSSFKIKGFRYNSDKVGSFKFVKKDNSYAASKQDGSDLNCGIIGVAIYSENLPSPINYTITNNSSYKLYSNDFIKTNTSDWVQINREGGPFTSTLKSTCAMGNSSTPLRNVDFTNINHCSNGVIGLSMSAVESPVNFDMGSTWGSSKESKVVDVEFERGYLLQKTDIHYASRQSLLDMGIILPNVGQVSFPNSFPKYATPPRGWTS